LCYPILDKWVLESPTDANLSKSSIGDLEEREAGKIPVKNGGRNSWEKHAHEECLGPTEKQKGSPSTKKGWCGRGFKSHEGFKRLKLSKEKVEKPRQHALVTALGPQRRRGWWKSGRCGEIARKLRIVPGATRNHDEQDFLNGTLGEVFS